MSLISFRAQESSRDTTHRAAASVVLALFEARPGAPPRLMAPECEVFGTLVGRRDWDNICAALGGIGPAAVRSTYGAQVGELALGDDPKATLGGPAHESDQLVLVDLETPKGAVTVGVLIDGGRAAFRHVKRVFDPAGFAALAE